jgi:hypothetical protein
MRQQSKRKGLSVVKWKSSEKVEIVHSTVCRSSKMQSYLTNAVLTATTEEFRQCVVAAPDGTKSKDLSNHTYPYP